MCLGLYAGTVPSLAANIAENSILFMAYGGCQKLVAKAAGVPRTEDLSVLHNGLSGFLAAFWSSLALCPTELVKCRYLRVLYSTVYTVYIGRLFEFKAVFRIHIHLIRIRPKSES